MRSVSQFSAKEGLYIPMKGKMKILPFSMGYSASRSSAMRALYANLSASWSLEGSPLLLVLLLL